VWLIVLTACSVDKQDSTLDTELLTPCEQTARDALTYEIGTGEATFEPLVDGAPLPFNLGPQGGWHVFGSFRATGVLPGDPEDFANPDNPTVSFQVSQGGASLGGYTDLPRPMDPAEGGGWEIVGDTLVLDISEPEEIDGTPALLWVSFLDGCGTLLEDAREVLLYDGDA